MSVKIIYEPVLLARLNDGRLFLEINPDRYGLAPDALEKLHTLADSDHIDSMIDWQQVANLLQREPGVASDITKYIPPFSDPWPHAPTYLEEALDPTNLEETFNRSGGMLEQNMLVPNRDFIRCDEAPFSPTAACKVVSSHRSERFTGCRAQCSDRSRAPSGVRAFRSISESIVPARIMHS